MLGFEHFHCGCRVEIPKEVKLMWKTDLRPGGLQLTEVAPACLGGVCPAVTALEFDGDKDKSYHLTPSTFKLSLLVNNLHCSKPDIVISRFLA